MKKMDMFVPVVSLFVSIFIASTVSAAGYCNCTGDDAESAKVVICHVPPGAHSNAHTIEVAEPAVQAHLNHGDSVGPCGNSDGDSNSNESNSSDSRSNDSNSNDDNSSDSNSNSGNSNDSNSNDAVAAGDGSCVCPDGSPGVWVPAVSEGGKSTRQIRGQ